MRQERRKKERKNKHYLFRKTEHHRERGRERDHDKKDNCLDFNQMPYMASILFVCQVVLMDGWNEFGKDLLTIPNAPLCKCSEKLKY